MKKTNHKKYDTKTDEKSRQAFKDIIKILEEYLKEKVELTISGSQDDYNGIDAKTLVTNKKLQIKNYVYCIRNLKVYSNTIVCPMKNYDEYIKNNIDYLFCSYYMDDNPTKIIQYGLIEINKLKNIKPDEIVQTWGEFKKDPLDLNMLGEKRDEAIRIFDKSGWK